MADLSGSKGGNNENEDTSFTLTKSDTSWICVQDKEFPLSESLSDDFVSSFTGISAVRELGSVDSDEVYGFTSTSPSVTITTTEDETCTFVLGNTNDMTGDYYLKREDTGNRRITWKQKQKKPNPKPLLKLSSRLHLHSV